MNASKTFWDPSEKIFVIGCDVVFVVIHFSYCRNVEKRVIYAGTFGGTIGGTFGGTFSRVTKMVRNDAKIFSYKTLN